MKKLFTLVAAVMLVTVSFAQYGPGGKSGDSRNDRNDRNDRYDRNDRNDRYDRNDRDVVYNDNRHHHPYDNRRAVYSFSPREREAVIVAINREYDRRSSEIRFRSFMSPMKRNVVLRQLEQERQMEIRQVWVKFNSPNNVFGDRYGYGRRY